MSLFKQKKPSPIAAAIAEREARAAGREAAARLAAFQNSQKELVR